MGTFLRENRLGAQEMPRARLTSEEIARYGVLVGDLLFARTSTMPNGLGKCAIVVTHKEPFVFDGNILCATLDTDRADPRFVYYFFTSEAGQQSIQEITGGTQSRSVPATTFSKVEVPCPPLAVQNAIARVLGSFDDKIELNRRMNQTLEEICRALFKFWFVDFGPVRAKMEGRWKKGESLPGMPADMWDLWPSEFEESEIGEIPKGWKLSAVGTETKTVLGGTPSRVNPSYWTSGTVGWINSGEVNRFRIVEPTEWITEEAVSNSAAKPLPAHTTVLAITGATIGQVSITETPTTTNQSVVGVLSTAELPTEFLYLWVRSRMPDLIAGQTGGAQQHINKNDVNELPLLVPPQSIMSRFLALSEPLFSRIRVGEFESLALKELRDALLPKLLSGEIRVKVDS
jgi:type I restriction enzyme S subunit